MTPPASHTRTNRCATAPVQSAHTVQFCIILCRNTIGHWAPNNFKSSLKMTAHTVAQSLRHTLEYAGTRSTIRPQVQLYRHMLEYTGTQSTIPGHALGYRHTRKYPTTRASIPPHTRLYSHTREYTSILPQQSNSDMHSLNITRTHHTGEARFYCQGLNRPQCGLAVRAYQKKITDR